MLDSLLEKSNFVKPRLLLQSAERIIILLKLPVLVSTLCMNQVNKIAWV